MEAELLASSLYEQIYHKVPSEDSSFDTNLLYKDAIFDVDLTEPYLEKYTSLSLHNYFDTFDEFMSLTRDDMNTFLTTIAKVLTKEARHKNKGEKNSLNDALKSLNHM